MSDLDEIADRNSKVPNVHARDRRIKNRYPGNGRDSLTQRLRRAGKSRKPVTLWRPWAEREEE